MHSVRGNGVQLIDGQGNFNEAGLETFVKTVKLPDCGLSYAVVSIMGPQSSGKSTLLNHLFGTSFREMDAFKGRSQTTQGVWLARANGIEPCTLVMDLEGTDGRERGEDDTAFEKQSSLFALAVSDVVLINMWCHDIGREHAANKPLLKTVFQVMMRLFSPRKTTLLFVIRDKTKTPLEVLDPILRDDVQKIWDSAPKPEKFKNSTLREFFQVEITALASFEEKEDLFKEQVSSLRQRFMNSIAPGGLAGDRTAVIPGSGFPFSAREIWRVIKENKDLDLPAHKVMVATVRCEEIAHQQFSALSSDEAWKEISESAKAGPVPNFGRRLNALLGHHFNGYDAEAAFFDASVKDSKRHDLIRRCLELVHPAYQMVIGHYRARAFTKFKQDLELSLGSSADGFAAVLRRCNDECMKEFDRGCSDADVEVAKWDPSKTREKLQRDLDAHAAEVKSQKLQDVVKSSERRLEDVLASSTATLLDEATDNTWPSIRELLSREISLSKAGLLGALASFELSKDEQNGIIDTFTNFARSVVERKAREEANQALMRMKDRFNRDFSRDSDLMPRVWTGDEDIRAITKDARASALKLLAVLAVMRLEESMTDNVEPTLMSLLRDVPENVQLSGNATTADSRSLTTVSTALAASSWEGVPEEKSLLSPVDCKGIWRQFQAETEYTISQALTAQEAKRRAASWLPPPWAIVAMVVLGFNEFMALLRNPLYLAIGFVLYLVGKAVWVQLDVGREFRNGWLAGLISIATKLVPTLMQLMKRLVEEGQRLAGDEQRDVYSGGSSSRQRQVPMEVPMEELRLHSGESSSSNGPAREGLGQRRQQQQQVYS